MYAVTTDFLDGDVKDILKFSEGRWEIEECFRVMKTDFETRPVFLHDDVRIKPISYLFSCGGNIRYLERDLGNAFSYEALLDKLRTMNFADIQEQGFIPLYTRDKLTNILLNKEYKTRRKF